MAEYCRPTWYKDPLAVPRCTGHDEPMQWARDVRKKAGGYWRCRIKHREGGRKYHEANLEKERERKRRYHEANPERVRAQWREYSRKWREANPVRKSMTDMKYNLRKQLERDEQRLAEVLKGRRA